MASRGRILEKRETGIPGVEIIRFELWENLVLRVLLKKPKKRFLHRVMETSDFDEATGQFGALYADIMQEPDRHTRKNTLEIRKLADLFMEEQEKRFKRQEIAEGTLKGKERTIYKGMLPFCSAHNLTKVESVNFKSFFTYATWRKDNYNYQQTTINTEIRHLKEFLLWAQKTKGHWQGFEWYVPTIKKVKGGTKPNAAYTDEMVMDMIGYIESQSINKVLTPYKRTQWKVFLQYFSFMLASGCRSAEPSHIQWKHVKCRYWNRTDSKTLDDVECDVHIPISKTGPRDILVKSPSLIYMKLLCEGLSMNLTGEDYVFMNIRSRKHQPTPTWNALFAEMHEQLGYGPETTLYSCRSTYLTEKILLGVPLSVLADQCGNSARVIEEDYKDLILKRNSSVLLVQPTVEGLKDEFTPLT
jgi:integrase